MECYRKLEATLPGELAEFPAIDVPKCEREINRCFKAYMFYRNENGGRYYQTSCCLKSGYMGESRLHTDRELQFMQAAHNELGICPFCGSVVTYKCIGRLGKKKNLLEYQPVVILKAKDGDIYARAFWTCKDYNVLDMLPDVKLCAAYRFHAGINGRWGVAWQYFPGYGGIRTVTMAGKYKTTERPITEPLKDIGYVAYHVVGLSEISKSKFKYCCYKELEEKRTLRANLMRLLTVASLYPDKVEMLRKSGLNFIVDDLVKYGRKNSAFFNWDAGNYKTAFKLTKDEIRRALELGVDSDVLSRYVKLRRKVSIETLAEIESMLFWDEQDFYDMCKNNSASIKKSWKYIKKQSLCIEDSKGKPSIHDSYRYWKDYLHMAAMLGWAANEEAVRYPHNIMAAHDRAVEETTAKLQREAEEAEMARLNKLRELEESRRDILKKRERKYNVSVDGYFIRVAESGEEILKEGRALQHCVGGYAERHLRGDTTILFLRRVEAPDRPLYTIEMQDNKLVQIHGYRNDAGVKVPPREEMAWLIDPWLDWLRNGSKRDKAGRPQINIIREELKAAI